MRTYSNSVATILQLDNIASFYLVEVLNNVIDIKHTNAPFDITIPGIGVFSADNELNSIDAPRLSGVVDREVYKIIYNDTQFFWRGIFEQGIYGAHVAVHIGFYNTTGANLNGVLPGKPLTDSNDLVTAYRGFVDTQGHSTDVDGDVTATIECSSPMADLDLKKTKFTSKTAARAANAGDTSYDQVYAGSLSVDLAWGKIRG
jgi:hypothetical protein